MRLYYAVWLYFKATKGYFATVFFPDPEDLADLSEFELEFKNTRWKRYKYYTIENFMIVDPATGCYVEYPWPKPFDIPGRIYWRALYIWQTKIVKTHN